MSNRLTNTIVVDNERALADALRSQYGTITLQGDISHKLKDSFRMYMTEPRVRRRRRLSFLQWAILSGLILWPFFRGSLDTDRITEDDMRNYRAYVSGNRTMLIHEQRFH